MAFDDMYGNDQDRFPLVQELAGQDFMCELDWDECEVAQVVDSVVRWRLTDD